MIDAVLLDIDGTLIDNTLLHALAWQRAFRRLGKPVDATTIIHDVGMGGNQLAPAILGENASKAIDQARRFHGEEYRKGLIEQAGPLPGAVDLLRGLRQRGVNIALASSGRPEEIEQYLRLLGGRQMVDAVVTSEDVAATKPAGDMFASALQKLGRPANALVVGGTIYDVASAGTLNLPCVGLLSGGIEYKLLIEAGAVLVYDGPADLLAHLDDVLNRPNLSNMAAQPL